MDSNGRLLLDGVYYFQVVFTLPSDLSSLALGNRQAIYSLLAQAACSALRNTVSAEQRYEPAALMVLHTWNRNWRRMVTYMQWSPAAGHRWTDIAGLRLPTTTWLPLRRCDRLIAHFPRARGSRQAISCVWKVTSQHCVTKCSWSEFLSELESTEWVSYIEPPPCQEQ